MAPSWPDSGQVYLVKIIDLATNQHKTIVERVLPVLFSCMSETFQSLTIWKQRIQDSNLNELIDIII